MKPMHPGEILREEFLVPLKLSASALAKAIKVPANRISAIVAEKRSITADTALRLGKAFSTTPEFWLNLQQAYELDSASRKGLDKIKCVAVKTPDWCSHQGGW
jgi:addiction module HigA family antidote